MNPPIVSLAEDPNLQRHCTMKCIESGLADPAYARIRTPDLLMRTEQVRKREGRKRRGSADWKGRKVGAQVWTSPSWRVSIFSGDNSRSREDTTRWKETHTRVYQRLSARSCEKPNYRSCNPREPTLYGLSAVPSDH